MQAGGRLDHQVAPREVRAVDVGEGLLLGQQRMHGAEAAEIDRRWQARR
jgi:hypothetical protein